MVSSLVMNDRKGTFIVIDGGDCSGKATQTELLQDRFKEERELVHTIDFPQYGNFFGELVGECLRGDYGNFLELHPKIASVLYASDRFESSETIREWLDAGAIVISDRYVSANQIHQGGKFDDDKKRQEFIEWLDKMEYGTFNIPQPDGIIYLDVPIRIALKLMDKNADELLQEKKYLQDGDVDTVEDSTDYLENSREAALKTVKERNNWYRIQCTNNGELLSKQAIHKKVYKQATNILE
jgi:dTMP kinase